MDSVVQAVIENAVKFETKTALVFKEKSVTYGQLGKMILSFSDSLKVRGIKKGSKVALEANDLIAFFAAFLGCHLSGCVSVPIENNISIYKLEDTVKSLKPALNFSHYSGEKIEDYLNSDEDIFNTIKHINPENEAAIISTTGTTGKPVHIVHTLRSMLASSENLVNGLGIDENTVLYSNIPFHLASGYRRVFAVLICGGTAVVSNNSLVHDVEDIIPKFKVSLISLVNSDLPVLLNANKDNLLSLEKVESLAGSLLHSNVEKFHMIYPSVTLYNVYGATESGCILINNTSENSKNGCLGKAAINAEVYLVDENNNPVETPGKYGYICVNGSMNMKGYWRRKALTERVVTDNGIIINDIAYKDEDGYYYFVSRVGDIINVKGHKVVPEDIENVALLFENIGDCACVAKDSKECGQVPVLFVVSEIELDLDKLKVFLSEKLESYKTPAIIKQIPKIPKTTTGKVLRKSLTWL